MPEGEYRLTDLDRRLTRVEGRLDASAETLKVQAVLEERISTLSSKIDRIENTMVTRMDKQEDDVKGLNRTLIGFGITVAAAAIGFAFTSIHFFG
jgi:hypothetical protein